MMRKPAPSSSNSDRRVRNARRMMLANAASLWTTVRKRSTGTARTSPGSRTTLVANAG
jgi:hypothetical protein